MSRTVIVVLDGFGIGAMPDAGALRPGDTSADTCGHLLDHFRRVHDRALRLPALTALGLGAVHPDPDLATPDGSPPAATGTPPVTAGRAALGYPGADTYAGHQTMMGADFSTVTVARLGDHLDTVAAALRAAGHRVEPLEEEPVLLVDGSALVHDNLEADPGINWNVSARLADLPFPRVLEVARTVRRVAPVARVIAVGGNADRPLPDFVRAGEDGTVGLDTPASGFYRNGGLQVQHLGVTLDHTRQLPDLAARAGVPVTLTGKAADILACEGAARHPAVDTTEVLRHTLDAVRGAKDALVVANVQETDLAGHQQDPRRYGLVLEQADRQLGELTASLDAPGDCLIVTGDHGNDPTIGHAFHTREFVPVLVHRPGSAPRALPDAGSLADVGATAAHCLGLPPGRLASGVPLPLTPVG
ncbi:phosphopentomutase [Streptomyces sp. NPDC005438]|uniref:phosphopentomutase n=1 Tax=Streptomyces sp. NPDC005438 TaxID=3156880 RepID=UPI0033B64BCC